MRHCTFEPNTSGNWPICVLVPVIQKSSIENEYLYPFGITTSECVAIELHHNPDKKKTPAAEMKAWIEQELQPVLDDCGVEYLVVGDSEYFKALTKQIKVEANLGYVLDSVFGKQKVVYVPNHRQVFYDPDTVRGKIKQGMKALLDCRSGQYEKPGNGIIKFAAYPETDAEIEDWLVRLLEMDRPLAIDTENFGLKHHSAGIGTISFAWSKHEGIAFPVDYVPVDPNNPFVDIDGRFGRQVRNDYRRKMLRAFFEQLTAKAIYHSISYDVYVLIYQLFMKDILDTAGLLQGLEVMLRNWDDTKLITYLATNSCAGNRLDLKSNSQAFSGNYALGDDIKDITKVPLPKLLTYNLVDALSTHYVHETRYPQMVADQQLDIYERLFKPCTTDIIQMQLTGMPVDMARAKEVDRQLQSELAAVVASIMASPIVEQFNYQLRLRHIDRRNAELKKKRIGMEDAETQAIVYNPNSDVQTRTLLFGFLKLPVINLTDSKLPSTDGETIEALLNRVTDPTVKALLEDLQLLTIIGTLTSNFMPAILGSIQGPDGWHYLFGNFNLGGTLSGRLSSSDPNLQNLPSTGKGHKIKAKYAKLIKSCFAAPPGWLLCGCDFSSLEDRISALTTKDPNKLKVYTDGYDGHSLRAYAYFGAQMPDILQSNGRRVFRITQGSDIHYLFEGETVRLPDGRELPIEQVI